MDSQWHSIIFLETAMRDENETSVRYDVGSLSKEIPASLPKILVVIE